MTISAGVIFFSVTLLWLWNFVSKKASIMDIFWGLGFPLHLGIYLGSFDSINWVNKIIFGIIAIWGLRLGLFIFWRSWKQPEDKRYFRFRTQHPTGYWWRSYLMIFGGQGLLMFLMSIPLLHILEQNLTNPLFPFGFWLGIVSSLLGIAYESVADHQLQAFRKKNPGKSCEIGLWKLSARPNYFGEILVWTGIYVTIMSAAPTWFYMITPLTIIFLLTKVTGIPLLDQNKYLKKSKNILLPNLKLVFKE